MNIDWSKPESKISKHFTVKEACLLPKWGVLHQPSETEKENIVKLAEILDQVIDKINLSMIVHCWIRPTSANCPKTKWDKQDYNKAVGSTATKSAHIKGNAIDFHFAGKTSIEDCLDMREKKLLPLLDSLKLRMEKKSGPWIHLDNAPVISNRYFPV